MPKTLVLYMTREDENQFLQYARSLGNLSVLPATSPQSDFAPVDPLPEATQEEATRRFWLHYTGTAMPLITEKVTDKDTYVIDGFQSPVIEFWRSWMISQVLMPGGIQADLVYIEDEKRDLAKKPAEFQDWFGSIDGWIRKNYTRLGIYIFAGPGARKFREEGGILQGR